MSQPSRFRLIPNIILIALSCLFFVVPNTKADELITTESGAQAVADEFIVKYKDEATFAEKQEFREVMDLEQERVNRDPLQKMNIGKVVTEEAIQPENITKTIENLENDPAVQYIEPNYLMSIQSVNDPSYSEQWSLAKIGVEEIWSETMGNAGVVIAVLDTGIDFSHPDRPKNIVAGYDFINDDSDPQDDHGHGTFVSGLIAANTNNTTGIAGICQNCSIMPVKVMNQNGIGTYADVANGIVWAADNGADIINLSIGGYAYSQILQDAVSYAQSKGVLIIAAGGNQGISSPLYPAAYPNVIGVAATTQNDERWSGSNYGSYIDISAPGVSIYGLALGSYRSQTGTSAAAPHIAGIAGLLMSKNQSLSPNLIAQQLYQNTVDLGTEGKDYSFGYGRIGFGTSENIIPEANADEDTENGDTIGQDESGDDNMKDDNNLNEDMGSTLPVPTEVTADMILEKIMKWTYDEEKIQAFLGKQSGILKGIFIDSKTGKEYTPSSLIESSLKGDGMITYNGLDNPRVVLVVLELVDEAVTNPNLTKDKIDNIFGVTRENYENLLKNSYYKIPGLSDIQAENLAKEDSQNTPLFFIQLDYTFNGINTSADLKNLLHNLANSEQQYKHWMSFEEGSFFSIYDKWFGLPVSLMEAKKSESAVAQTTEIIEPKSDDFLKSAYDKNDRDNFCGITSFVDHSSPNYSNNQEIVLFSGKILPSADAESSSVYAGYNAYDGHNGWDLSIKNCVSRTSNNILATANGRVIENHSNTTDTSDPNRFYGNYLILGHNLDVSNDDLQNNIIRYEYYTRYAHLKDPSSFAEETDVQAGDAIGVEGGTGGPITYATHLHFDVKKIIYEKNGDDLEEIPIITDPMGWWGSTDDGDDEVKSDPWASNTNGTSSEWLWESKQKVDNEDQSFFDFNKTGSRWVIQKDKGKEIAEGGSALYTNAMLEPENKWDNWAWWTGNLPEAGKYKVYAYIPTYTVEGKDVTEKAKYYIYHSTGRTEKIINQSDSQGKWAFLGEYTFEKGPKGAVRLVDEVTNEMYCKNGEECLKKDKDGVAIYDEKNLVIWADAVKWESANQDPKPDLKFIIDSDFKFSYEEKDRLIFSDYILYNASIKVKNIGDTTSTNGEVCFLPNGSNYAKGCVDLDNIASGEDVLVKLKSFKENFLYGNNPIGKLVIRNIPKDSDLTNNEYKVPLSAMEDLGGIDLTNAELGGIKIDPNTDQIKFVIKGKEAQAGDEVIDLNNAKSEQTKIFLQALAVPNYKHYISLDIVSDGSGFKGSARVPDPFEQTDIADAFLKADVAMKFDLFSASTAFDSNSDWINLVKSSPYWPELSAKGFNRFPTWTIAATIIPGNINATQTGNEFFLEDIELDIDAGWWMREPAIDLSGLDLSSGAYNDLTQRLATHKLHIENAVKSRALDFTIPELNNTGTDADPRFKKLRSIYAAISAAQWYKEQVKLNPELPYAHIVDSEDLSDFGIDHVFDRSYWNGQAYQDLGSRPCVSFSGQATCSYRGGASLQQSEPEIIGKLTGEQGNILYSAIDNLETVQSGEDTYLYGGTVTAAGPDIELSGVITESDKYVAASPITFDVQVFNAGTKDASDVKLKVYDEVISDGGQKTIHAIDEKTIFQIASWQGVTKSFSYTLPGITGIHSIYAVADPLDAIHEMSEANNQSRAVIQVFDPHPAITLISPVAGSIVHPDGITFEAAGNDPITGAIENDSSFEWSSNIDGNLGTGRKLTVNSLSEDDHQITLEVMGSHGVSGTKTFNLYVRPQGTPLPRIKYPIDGGHLSKELAYKFIGQAEDNEDGTLSGSSLTWSSSIDGQLGSGVEINIQLSEGNHTIMLSAIDSNGNENTANINITVETGTPTLTVTSPGLDAVIVEGTVVQFTGSASDPQEGDISSRIIWSSNIDGMLSQSTSFSRLLSEGNHKITAMIVDSDGLKASKEINISVKNTSPQPIITSPVSQTQIDLEEQVTLVGNATDLQDGVIPPESLTWSSDRDGYLGEGESVTVGNLSAGWHLITLTAVDSKGMEGSTSINLNVYVGIPTVNILQPAGGQQFKFGANITLEGSANDDQDGVLSGNNLVWTSSLDGVLGTGTLLTLSNLTIGTHTIRLEATDSDNWKSSAETSIKINPLKAPQVSILFPSDGGKFEQGKDVHFYGMATDSEDGILPTANITWSSSIDGQIGTGKNFSKNNLSLGEHIITMTASDSDGLTAKSEVRVTVTLAPPNVTIISPADGTVLPVGKSVTLTGSGADTFTWSSNIDGELGVGSSVTTTLSLGTHQIMLTGIDSSGAEGTTQITLTVADESSLAINQFADGSLSQTLDFGTGTDYILNLAIAKDAVVDSAQVTLHAQRGMDVLETLSVQSETPNDVETQDLASPEEGVEEEPVEEFVQPKIEIFETVSAGGGEGEPVDLEENMGVMATNYTILDHYMTSSTDWANPPRHSSSFSAGEAVYSWLRIGNLTENGQVKWVVYAPDGWTSEGYLSIFTGYSWYAGYYGWSALTQVGQYRIEVFLKGNSSPDWTHYYTEYFQMHEYPSEAPTATVDIQAYDKPVYENESAQLYFLCNDNSQRAVNRSFYWNDGSGWQSDIKSGWFLCNGGAISILPYDPIAAEIGFLDLPSYQEGTTVQYYGKVTDFDNNTTQTSTQSFTVLDSDTVGPAITNLLIEEGDGADMDGSIDETEPIKISWKAIDTSGIGEMLFHLNGEPQNINIENGFYVVRMGPQSVGSHSYTITATDGDNSPATKIKKGTFEVFRKPFIINPSLDATDDGDLDWQYAGDMESDQITGNFASAINDYIGSNNPETDGKVLVPLRFRADGGNVLKVQDISLLYRITDTTPPTIADITLNPVQPSSGQNVSIGATVYDNTAIEEVTADLNGNSVVMIAGEDNSYTGSLIAPSAGDHDLIITARDESGLTSESITPVKVTYNGAELFTESVIFNPSSPLLSGQNTDVTIVLGNAGTQSADAEVQISHITAETHNLNIPAGGTAVINTSFTLPAPGDNALTVTIDPQNLIAESDEDNNVFVYNYQTSDSTPPVFEEINIPEYTGADQQFEVGAKVTDDISMSAVTAQWLGQEFALEAGADNWYSVSLTAPSNLGSQSISLTARDHAGLTSIIERQIGIVDSRPNPYVTQSDISVTGDNILALETPEFQINLHNNGGSDADTPILIKLDDNEVYSESNLIKSGSISTINWNGWQATGGTHELSVTLDPQNVLAETNESDNTAIYNFIVPYTLPPQLSNLSITEDVLENQSFEISVDVLGDQEIKNVTININGSDYVMTSLDGIKYSYSGLLPIGSYPFQITAINISDLAARMPGVLIVNRNLADLAVDIPLISPASLTNNDTAEFGITVRNNGFITATDIPVEIKLDSQNILTETVTLSPKSEITLPVISWDALSGAHILGAEIDSANIVQEIDETNNSSSFSFNVGNVNPPDIIEVTTKEILYTNETFAVEANIEDEVGISVTAIINGSGYQMNYDDASGKYLADLTAPSSVGDYSMAVVAQNTDGLSSNWERNVTVLSSTPDLAINPSDISITPSGLVENQAVTIAVLAHNYGGTDLNDVAVVFKVSGSVLDTKALSVVRGGSALTAFEWIPDFGVQDIAIELDPNNSISESNESNNSYRASLFADDITTPTTPILVADATILSAIWSNSRDWKISWPDVEENNLKGYSYQTDGGIWNFIGFMKEIDVHFDTAGEHMVCVMAEDLAGNISQTACTSVLLDFEAPEAPVLMGGTNNHWSSDPVKSVIWTSPLDDGSGPEKYLVRINGENTELGNQNYYQQTWEDGQYTAQVSAIDKMEHQSGWSNEVKLLIDTTGPEDISNVTSSTHPESSSWYANTNPDFNWDIPNDLSGVQGFYYYIDQNPDTSMDSRYRWMEGNQLIVPADESLGTGNWFLHITPVDYAGNTASQTSHFKFQIDLDAPQTTVMQIVNNTVLLDAYDPHSGIKNVYYAIGGQDEMKTQADYEYNDFNWKIGDSIVFPLPGTYQIYYYSEDNLGNREDIRSETVNVTKAEQIFNIIGGGYGDNANPYYRHLETGSDDEDTNAELEKYYSYLKLRKDIICSSKDESDARCFWAKVQLVYMKELLGKTDIEDVITAQDIKRVVSKIVLFKKRYHMHCEDAEDSAKYCNALGRFIEAGEYFINKE